MAAAIKDKLGVEANLREGHGGIFEVAIDDDVLYTNNRKCGNLPQNEDVVSMIQGYMTGDRTGSDRMPGGGGTCGCSTEGGSCCG